MKKVHPSFALILLLVLALPAGGFTGSRNQTSVETAAQPQSGTTPWRGSVRVVDSRGVSHLFHVDVHSHINSSIDAAGSLVLTATIEAQSGAGGAGSAGGANGANGAGVGWGAISDRAETMAMFPSGKWISIASAVLERIGK